MANDALAAVAAKFRASLVAKADEIEAVARARAAGGSPDALAALMHKLAGSAGFYAETAIAALASDLERRLGPDAGESTAAAGVATDIARLAALMRTRAGAP